MRPTLWRELFTRAASAEGGASKQLAPHQGHLFLEDHKSVPLHARGSGTRITLQAKVRTGKYGTGEYKSIETTANFRKNIDASYHSPM